MFGIRDGKENASFGDTDYQENDKRCLGYGYADNRGRKDSLHCRLYTKCAEQLQDLKWENVLAYPLGEKKRVRKLYVVYNKEYPRTKAVKKMMKIAETFKSELE